MEPPLGVLIGAAPGCDLRLVEEAEDQLPLAFGASETARRLIRPLGCVPVAVWMCAIARLRAQIAASSVKPAAEAAASALLKYVIASSSSSRNK